MNPKVMAAIQKLKAAAEEIEAAMSGEMENPEESMEMDEGSDKKKMFIAMMKKKEME